MARTSSAPSDSPSLVTLGVIGIVIIFTNTYLWYGFFAETRRQAPAGLVAFYIVFVGASIAVFIWMLARREGSSSVRLTLLVNNASLLLAVFSFVYWTHGTTVNFSQNLSHLDALYFAMGTFSTAGTGSVSAKSEWARGIQTLQMGFDVAFVAFGVALLVSRLGSRKTP